MIFIYQEFTNNRLLFHGENNKIFFVRQNFDGTKMSCTEQSVNWG